MLLIQDTIVSEDLISKDFVCNISKCKGVCCVEGESGAPLEADEVSLLQENYDKILPFLNEKGRASIAAMGVHVVGEDGSLETPLVENAECAYAVFSELGVASCGIENAARAGAIAFDKPISCNLYPVRVNEYKELTAVNYHNWPICETACDLGAALKIPVYQFVKDALIRKFGKTWYRELELHAEHHSQI